MRRTKALLLVTLVTVLLYPSLTVAQAGGFIGVYADPNGEDCHPQDIAPGLLQVFVVHTGIDEATGSEFQVVTGDGFEGLYLGEALGMSGLMYGNSQTGVAVGYAACLEAPIHVLTLSYYVEGGSAECCYFEVVEFNGGVNVVDCDMILVEGVGLKTFVNPDGNCQCAMGSPTPTETASWGHIKSLYAGN